eukprot:jgi/Phyca11/105598/e_gw1.11.330.1
MSGAGSAGASSGGNNAAGGGGGRANANQARDRHVSRGSTKAPKFEGSFEVFQAEIQLYLEDREAWDVVTGAEVRDNNDADLQALFDRKNRLGKSTILRGLRGCQDDMADKVCSMATAKEMWDSVVADKTQRDFSYAVLLRRHLYHQTHAKGQPMGQFIASMTRIRQQLRNIGPEHTITDEEMSRLLLMGVSLTHPELVEQFDLPTRQGTPPTLQQVTNALRSKDERNRMAETVGGSSVEVNGGAVVMSLTGTTPQKPANRAVTLAMVRRSGNASIAVNPVISSEIAGTSSIRTRR